MLQYLSLGALVLRAPRRVPPSIRCSAELPELSEGAWRPPRIDAGALSVGQIVAGTIVSRGERGYSMDVGYAAARTIDEMELSVSTLNSANIALTPPQGGGGADYWQVCDFTRPHMATRDLT